MNNLSLGKKSTIAKEKIQFTRIKQEDMQANACISTSKNLPKAHSINL